MIRVATIYHATISRADFEKYVGSEFLNKPLSLPPQLGFPGKVVVHLAIQYSNSVKIEFTKAEGNPFSWPEDKHIDQPAYPTYYTPSNLETAPLDVESSLSKNLRGLFAAPVLVPLPTPPQSLIDQAEALGYELVPNHRIKTCNSVRYIPRDSPGDLVLREGVGIAEQIGRELANKLIEFDKIKIDEDDARDERRLSCSVRIIVPD